MTTHHVPPGRSLKDMPKSEPKPVPSGAPKPPNTSQTFRSFLTQDGAKDYLVEFLVELAKKRKPKKGAPDWKGYLQFYAANQSGDFTGTGPTAEAFRKKCEKIVNDLNDAYLEAEL